MAVPAVNIEIEQGADFTSTFTITNSDGSVFNMSSASAVAKAKKHPTAGTAYTFSTSIESSTGKITISMTDEVTATMESGRYLYDILLTAAGGDKTRVIQGMALVTAGIS
tara:strand:+ start:580 stop:909 length:330 start_codon:yes stop_codon:yes gene_type:complete